MKVDSAVSLRLTSDKQQVVGVEGILAKGLPDGLLEH